jgi:hypothetical protein
MLADGERMSEFPEENGAVRDRVRATQQGWLEYRRAFLDLAEMRYPQVEKRSVAAVLDRQRTKLLNRLPIYS